MECVPTFTNGDAAFPYTASNSGTIQFLNDPAICASTFHWGWTTSGNPTGQAIWTFDFLPSGVSANCNIWVFIPDNHAGAPHAQYFIFDGSHYLANVIVNQEETTGWKEIYSGSGFTEAPTGPKVTLSDKDPAGDSGWEIAAAPAHIACQW